MQPQLSRVELFSYGKRPCQSVPFLASQTDPFQFVTTLLILLLLAVKSWGFCFCFFFKRKYLELKMRTAIALSFSSVLDLIWTEKVILSH